MTKTTDDCREPTAEELNTVLLTLKSAHKHSFLNQEAVNASELAGCFYCCEVYPPSQVKRWVPENCGGKTAICPKCGIDSVLGSASGYPLTADFLKVMEWYWFERETVETVSE